MKQKLAILASVALFSAATALAQTSTLSPKKGASWTYDVAADMAMEQSLGGQSITVNSNTSTIMDLKVTDLPKQGIEWSYGAREVRSRVSGDMIGEMDTVIQGGEPVRFVTDRKGTVTSNRAAAPELEMMGGGFARVGLDQLFAPTLSRSLKEGESWETTRVDTTAANGVDVEVAQTIRFTYEGTVDTLGMKAIRLRGATSSMTLSGRGTTQGANIIIDGDGSNNYVAYYSAKDGLLLAMRGVTEIDARASLTGPAEMVIPMNWNITTSSVRRTGTR